jgi:hypothetical protein
MTGSMSTTARKRSGRPSAAHSVSTPPIEWPTPTMLPFDRSSVPLRPRPSSPKIKSSAKGCQSRALSNWLPAHSSRDGNATMR